MKQFEEKDWTFLNINSPADLWADYQEDGSVRIQEYDRCRNGHFLISRFYVDDKNMNLQIQAEEADAGVAVGVYFGQGGFDSFWQVAVKKDSVLIQRPNGVSLGDTFRYEGTERMENLVEKSCEIKFPCLIRVEKQDEICKVFVDGKKYLECSIFEGFLQNEKYSSTQNRWGRVLIGALNLDTAFVTKAILHSWQVGQEYKFLPGSGQLRDLQGNIMPGYSLHLCGMGEHWTRTDRKGIFVFGEVPDGIFDAVAGIAGETYWRLKLEHSGDSWNVLEMKNEELAGKEIYEEVTSETEKINLNGIWDFEWDKDGMGEWESWYLPGAHTFSKVIQVPFSFHSLEAFGESFFAGDENMFQAASWYVNLHETGDTVWYQRKVIIPESGIWEIVFDAVCGYAKVWINAQYVGCTVDSYEKFRLDMGEFEAGEEVVLTVQVKYPLNDKESCRGKQDFWFHASPGIWQTVWMEKIQDVRVEDILTEYQFCESFENKNEECVNVTGGIFWNIRGNEQWQLELQKQGTEIIFRTEDEQLQGLYRLIFEYEAEETENILITADEETICCSEWDATGYEGYNDKKIVYMQITGKEEIKLKGWRHCFQIKAAYIEKIESPEQVNIKVAGSAISRENKFCLTEDGKIKTEFQFSELPVKKWEIEKPVLYDLEVEVCENNGKTSAFCRKIGFRTVSAEKYVNINGEEQYIRGVLDQGYNPWGIYTYLSARCQYGKKEAHAKNEKGTMEYDIRKAKEYGYNLIRMHIKDNEPEWYRICDEQGILVWDEHPLNFYAKWDNGKWRSMYYRRLKDMIRKQNYHPSIVLYSTFNESWGIMGGHELSAWGVEKAQQWQKQMASYFHANSGNVLVVDNSGYAKTGETDILDYHMYPDEFEDADSFFTRLEKENYNESHFNCYHQKNRISMQDDMRRELLQRNCRINLRTVGHQGNEKQHGQPVILSEFVHTGRLEQLVRKFAGIAGFIRMNIASQENEDTSPLSATRAERDFGYRHYDFSRAGYAYINSENLVWPDIPVLSKRKTKETVTIPIYTRIWKKCGCVKLYIYESRTSFIGKEKKPELIEVISFDAQQKEPCKVMDYSYIVPEACRSVQLFFVLKEENEILAENDVRFEVFDEKDRNLSWQVGIPEQVQTTESHGKIGDYSERDGYYLKSNGNVVWKIPCMIDAEKEKEEQWILRMELSTCECVEGTRITDEKKYAGYVTVELNDRRQIKLLLEDSPWDEKAVFSNSGSSKEKIVPYKKWGKIGYGFQQNIILTREEVVQCARQGYLKVKLYTDVTGVVVYGRRLGRYGTEPMVIRKGAEENEI